MIFHLGARGGFVPSHIWTIYEATCRKARKLRKIMSNCELTFGLMSDLPFGDAKLVRTFFLPCFPATAMTWRDSENRAVTRIYGSFYLLRVFLRVPFRSVFSPITFLCTPFAFVFPSILSKQLGSQIYINQQWLSTAGWRQHVAFTQNRCFTVWLGQNSDVRLHCLSFAVLWVFSPIFLTVFLSVVFGNLLHPCEEEKVGILHWGSSYTKVCVFVDVKETSQPPAQTNNKLQV